MELSMDIFCGNGAGDPSASSTPVVWSMLWLGGTLFLGTQVFIPLELIQVLAVLDSECLVLEKPLC